MAAGTLAAPGTEVGPCRTECEHRDCAATRRIAEAECHHCEKPIGYDVRFYRLRELEASDGKWYDHSGRVYAHARCEEEAVLDRCVECGATPARGHGFCDSCYAAGHR